jgi:hypothetical protein
MLGVARSVAGFVQRIDDTARNLDGAINDVRRTVLNAQTLSNLQFTVQTLQQVSVGASVVVSNLDSMVRTDAEPVGVVISNLQTFTIQLQALAQSAQNLVDTNAPKITLAVNNLEASTAALTNLFSESAHSKGLVGTLVFDPTLSSNVSTLTTNLALFSANLRSNGLWHVLWKPKPGDYPAPAAASTNKTTK